MNKRGFVSHIIALFIGAVAFAVFFIVQQYVLAILLRNIQIGFFQYYLFQAIVFGLPPFLLAMITSFFTYGLILKHTTDHECRCRKCGYILKGISEPKCSECGEPI